MSLCRIPYHTLIQKVHNYDLIGPTCLSSLNSAVPTPAAYQQQRAARGLLFRPVIGKVRVSAGIDCCCHLCASVESHSFESRTT